LVGIVQQATHDLAIYTIAVNHNSKLPPHITTTTKDLKTLITSSSSYPTISS